jgi:hypothetical protein
MLLFTAETQRAQRSRRKALVLFSASPLRPAAVSSPQLHTQAQIEPLPPNRPMRSTFSHHEIKIFRRATEENEKLIKKVLDRKIDLSYTRNFALWMSESKEEG